MAVTVREGGLGPEQLKWLRKYVPKFAEAQDKVKAADENAAKARAKLEPKQ